MNCVLFYFHWKPAVIMTCLVPPCQLVIRSMLFDEPIVARTVIKYSFQSIWTCFSLLLFIYLITKAGIFLVESEILRSGNEDLLNNLEEGVMILSQDDQDDCIFLNDAAKKL